jgi:hypothetical protein
VNITPQDPEGHAASDHHPRCTRFQRSRNSVPSRPDSRRSRGTTSTIDADDIETCAGPEAEDALSHASFGDHGTREFFTHVRFHKHDEDRIVVHCRLVPNRASA